MGWFICQWCDRMRNARDGDMADTSKCKDPVFICQECAEALDLLDERDEVIPERLAALLA